MVAVTLCWLPFHTAFVSYNVRWLVIESAVKYFYYEILISMLHLLQILTFALHILY